MTFEQISNPLLGPDTARANLLTNGGFEIWQRGNGPFTASGAYTADRWIIGLNGSSTMSVSRYNASSGPSGAVSYAAQVTYTHNTSSWLMQAIKTGEYQELRGRMVTFSAGVFSSANNAARLSVASDGTGGSTVYSSYATGTSTWQSLSVTYTVPTDSTVVNVRLWLDASCTAYIDNAMLVVGSQAANYVPLHPADDLARCLRYYENIGTSGGNDVIVRGWAGLAGEGLDLVMPFRAYKPVTPTVTKIGTWATANCAVGSPSFTASTQFGIRMSINATAGGGDTYAVNSNAGNYVTAEANP